MKRIFVAVISLIAVVSVFGKDIYVSPSGGDSAAGTAEAPYLTIRKAIESAAPGTNIYLREGVYKPQPADIMRRGASGAYDVVYDLSADGTAEAPILIAGCDGEKVTIDLSDIRTGERVIGFNLMGDYWHLRNFDIGGIQVMQTGHTQSINVGLFGGNNCTVERVNMHDGMGIGVYATKGSNNLILNCDAYNNYDPISDGGYGGNCDGFGFHIKGDFTGNVIRGCRAWRNSDDGYDLINNYSPVTIENCWAWQNGYDADKVSRGDGTGIKSGGFGMKKVYPDSHKAPRNRIINCLAWDNKVNGIYANHHLGGNDFIGNVSCGNLNNYNMVNRKSPREIVDVAGYGHRLEGNVSYKPRKEGGDCVNVDEAECTLSGNIFTGLSEADFESLDASQLLQPRKPDGSLPDITFLKRR